MTFPESPYIEERDGGLYVSGTRITLDTIVVRFQEGHSPERIVESFPTVELWQAYGAIAYYLEHQQTIDGFIAEVERRFKELVPPLSVQNPALYARLQAAREKLKRA